MNEANKQRYIYIEGQAVPVSEDVYRVCKHYERKEEYFSRDLKSERFQRITNTFLPSREDSYERLQEMAVQFPEENRSVEDQILKKIECEQLHKFLLELSKEEQWLIQELYFEERTEREVASVLGLSQKAINKRRQKILEKLRKLF